MFQLFFIIISYGALLLLLMPSATVEGILSTVVAFVIGLGLIVYTKVHKNILLKNKYYLLFPFALYVGAYCGVIFYNRWLISVKMQSIANMFHMSIEMFLFVCSLFLSGLSLYFFYVLFQIIVGKLSDTNPKNDLGKNMVSCIVASVTTVIIAQIMIDTEILSMGPLNFMCGVLIVAMVIIFIYCLLGKIIPSIFLGSGFFMVISTINVYVYNFRERLFEPVDIFSASTAMNVVENYNFFPIPFSILIGWVIFAIVLILLHFFQHNSKLKISVKERYVLLMTCIIGSIVISFYTINLKTYHWRREGALFNGYILDFVSKFKEISVPKPDDYSTVFIDELAQQYSKEGNIASEGELTEYPHIIVIMDEAFSDLGVIGEFTTNEEYMPFITTLKENTISGYALASVYGGNTANSEYEFLTGNSLAWLSPNIVPYQQYINSPTYSMVSCLKLSYDYKCVAMHPYQSSGWNRPTVYNYLGFDECYFIENFPQENYVRKYVSDTEMFEFLIDYFEQEKENLLFLFGITMQNHGDYNYSGKNYTQHISLTDYVDEYPDVEQYLSLIYETDRAVEYLITYFQNIDDNVVIVFFGDHQPRINESFYETVSGNTPDTLDDQQKRYEVPFFIWTNYEIEEKYIDSTSLNYLSTYVYEAAGIMLPPYNQFLYEMEGIVPSINANGFYSISEECYLPLDEASETELRWLKLYEILQYNNMFETKERNEIFFPTINQE